eukprot:scaffold117179_cov28-Tisochrysis_lutea.AAC.2
MRQRHQPTPLRPPQAQLALHSKAVAEGTSPAVRAKLAEGAAQLFTSAKRVFDRPHITAYLCERLVARSVRNAATGVTRRSLAVA